MNRLLIYVLCCLIPLLSACKDERKSSENSAEESPEEEQEPAGSGMESQPAEQDPAPSPSAKVGDDLAFQDSMRALQTVGVWLVMETVAGPDSGDVTDLRTKLAALAETTPNADNFGQVVATYVQHDLKPWAHADLKEPVEAAIAAVNVMTGVESPASFAAAIKKLRDAPPELARAGVLFELAQGLRALKAGAAHEGSPAFGVVNASICPDAPWLEGNAIFQIAASGELPVNIDPLATLKTCFRRCDNVDSANDIRSLAKLVAACQAAPTPETDLEQPVFDSALSLLDLAAVGAVQDSLDRMSGAEGMLIDGALSDRVSELTREFLRRQSFIFGWPIPRGDLPPYAGVKSDQPKQPYILVLGPNVTFGAWPHMEVENNALALSRLHGTRANRSAQYSVDLSSPTMLQRVVRSELRSAAGIVATPDALVGTFQQGLKALRLVRMEEISLAVRSEAGDIRWLPISLQPTAPVDALVQQIPGFVNVWIHPGGVSEAAIEALPADDPESWPGTVARIPTEELRAVLPAIHDTLASTNVTSVLFDLDGQTSIGDMTALLQLIDRPRAPGIQDTDELLAADPVNAERRIEGLYFTEQAAAALPGSPAATRQGVTLPQANEITLTGPLTVEVVQGKLAELQRPLDICYERELAESPDLTGTVTIQLTLDVQGGVTATSVVSNSTGSELLQACVVDGVEFIEFDVPAGNTELGVIKLPVHFDLPAEVVPGDE